jgi:hypothetical protein
MQWPPRHPFCRGFDAATSGDASGAPEAVEGPGNARFGARVASNGLGRPGGGWVLASGGDFRREPGAGMAVDGQSSQRFRRDAGEPSSVRVPTLTSKTQRLLLSRPASTHEPSRVSPEHRASRRGPPSARESVASAGPHRKGGPPRLGRDPARLPLRSLTHGRATRHTSRTRSIEEPTEARLSARTQSPNNPRRRCAHGRRCPGGSRRRARLVVTKTIRRSNQPG